MRNFSLNRKKATLLAAAVLFAGAAWLAVSTSAAPGAGKSASSPSAQGASGASGAPLVAALEEIRFTLRDENIAEGARIRVALDMLDEAIGRANAGEPLGALPASPLGADPFFANDPFFSDPFAGAGTGAAWDPFEEIRRMRMATDQMFDNAQLRYHANSPGLQGFGGAGASFQPSVDISEEAGAYVARVDLPGVGKSDVKVEVQGQTLVLSGEREETVERSDPQGRVVSRERRVGTFHRAIPLPGPVDAAKVEAKHGNGVLTVTLPKKDDESGPVAVPVQ